jgi:putative endonuclease
MTERSKRDIGAYGEDIAVKYLKKHKYKIVERNYLCRYGEVDIIAKDGKTVAFVEVKSRKAGGSVNPLYSVNKRKQMQICKAAQDYIIKNKIKNTMFRFDVLTVIYEGDKSDVQLIKNAFDYKELNQ